jgi:hypothetical protein
MGHMMMGEESPHGRSKQTEQVVAVVVVELEIFRVFVMVENMVVTVRVGH